MSTKGREIQLFQGYEDEIPLLKKGEPAYSYKRDKTAHKVWVGTEEGNQLLQGETVVENSLVSTSTTEALSANMGKTLREMIEQIANAGNKGGTTEAKAFPLETTADNQKEWTLPTRAYDPVKDSVIAFHNGVYLNPESYTISRTTFTIPDNPIVVQANNNVVVVVFKSIPDLTTTISGTLITSDSITLDKFAQEVWDVLNNGGIQIIDSLNSTDATKSLSAKQGKILHDNTNDLAVVVNNHKNDGDVHFTLGQKETWKKILGKNEVIDSRDEVQIPRWYWENNKKRTLYEFKSNVKLGLPQARNLSQYSAVQTIIAWDDRSGGEVKQVAYHDDGVFYRTSVSEVSWSSWSMDFKHVMNRVEGADLNTYVTPGIYSLGGTVINGGSAESYWSSLTVTVSADVINQTIRSTNSHMQVRTGIGQGTSIAWGEWRRILNDVDYDKLFTLFGDKNAKIASAITDKGVPTSADATGDQMAANIRAISTGKTSHFQKNTIRPVIANGTHHINTIVPFEPKFVFHSTPGTIIMNGIKIRSYPVGGLYTDNIIITNLNNGTWNIDSVLINNQDVGGGEMYVDLYATS